MLHFLRTASTPARAASLAAIALLTAAGGALLLRGWFREPPRRPLPDAAVRAALDRPVSVDVHEAPLAVVLADLSRQADVRIDFEPARLLRPSVSDVPGDRLRLPYRPTASVRASTAPLRAVLRSVLDECNLTYVVLADRLDVIFIDDLAQHFTTRIHPVGDLLSGEGTEMWTETELCATICEFVEPDSWKKTGGTAHIEPAPGALLVAHSEIGHGRVATALDLLRRLKLPQSGPQDYAGWGEPGTLGDRGSPRVAAIRTALAQPVSLRAANRLLGDILDELALSSGLDAPAVEGAEAPEHRTLLGGQALRTFLATERATHRFENVPLAAALERVFGEHDLAWSVCDGSLEIAWEDKAYELRAYPTRGLLAPREGFDGEQLAELVREIVLRDAGPGSVQAIPGGLLVAHVPSVHDQVARLLAQLARLQDPAYFRQDERDLLELARTEPLFDRPVSIDWREAACAEALPVLLAEVGIDDVRFVRLLDADDLRRSGDAAAQAANPTGFNFLESDTYNLGNFRFTDLLWESKVTLRIRDVPLRNALNLILDSVAVDTFTWEWDGRTLYVVLAASDYKRDIVRFYRTPRWWFGARGQMRDFMDLAASLDEFPQARPVPGGLVVEQRQSGQRRMAWLLGALRRLESADCPLAQSLQAAAPEWPIRNALYRPVSLPGARPEQARLDEVLAALAVAAEIEGRLWVDWRRLEGYAVEPDNMSFWPTQDVTLRAALAELLPLPCGWTIRDGVLAITAPGHDKEYPYLRVYRFTPPATLTLPAGMDWTSVLECALEPGDDWRLLAEWPWCELWHGGLVAHQTAAIHAELEALLTSLEAGDPRTLDRLRQAVAEAQRQRAELDAQLPVLIDP
jgi:hypothetical protein